MQRILSDAQAYGARLAQLLDASSLPEEQKEAWIQLIPSMTVEQIQLFELILRKDLDDQARHLLEDALLEIKAQATKRDLAVAAVKHKASTALDDLEDKIDRMERAAGKRD